MIRLHKSPIKWNESNDKLDILNGPKISKSIDKCNELNGDLNEPLKSPCRLSNIAQDLALTQLNQAQPSRATQDWWRLQTFIAQGHPGGPKGSNAQIVPNDLQSIGFTFKKHAFLQYFHE